MRTVSWLLFIVVFAACSTTQKISRQATTDVLSLPALQSAHIGISVYDPATKKYLYNYQSTKSFIPASNTKLFTCYAAMKYLGDSLVAARYVAEGNEVRIQATGDPTFLHSSFKEQPLLKFLQQPSVKSIYINTAFQSQSFGRGWAWDDYTEGYMAERDPFPMYGNVARFIVEADTLRTIPPYIKSLVGGEPVKNQPWKIDRYLGRQFYVLTPGKGTKAKEKSITMSMERGAFAHRLLSDTLHKQVLVDEEDFPASAMVIHSQPTDSMLKMMMHNSDNFFAEQSLLMVSQQKLGAMNDRKVIDTLLKTDYAQLPQPPQWVDGSGLSRYNLFSPNDFVWLLSKMKDDFTFDRVKEILPGANEGTLEGRYKGYEGRIFAKTGTLSNNVALSGYVITKKNKQLIFSILVNNHGTSAATVRNAMEKFVTSIIDRY
jgi:serine-type D-Ala-D-Ala carboxypeptidase/endopeptidase (penicillin-binding protein 4)